jgi:NAD(P)-dependent dehydrogenase (short-subunit alcohol dehydrogenase family)
MKLENRTIIVTGGAGELAGVLARRLLAEGANLVLGDLDPDALEARREALDPDRVRVLAGDVGAESTNAALVAAAEETFGGLHGFVANAGIEGPGAPLAEQTAEGFDTVMRVNVRGPFLGLKHALPAIARSGGGAGIILSSIMGVNASAGLAPYCTSKHAVIGLMRSAAVEGAPLGVRVNTINPAPLDGRMIRSIEHSLNPGMEAELRAGYIDTRIPMGRYGTFEDMTGLFVLLLGDEGRFLTGSVYMADGGMSAI